MTTPVNDPAVAASVSKLIEVLEDHDDVKEVYCTAELPDN
jgi:transcriptional/translational regulatory protein YebC/TACO1